MKAFHGGKTHLENYKKKQSEVFNIVGIQHMSEEPVPVF